MSTALAVRDFTEEQVKLIKQQIAPKASDGELALFMAQCKRTGLDPFSRQIHATFRWNRKEGREVMTVQTGIDGFRVIASRTGSLDGQDGPYWCGADGVWRDVWLSNDPPAAAKVMIYRKGCSRPFAGIASYPSYCQRDKDGNPAGLWRTMADNQLAKCAEALGLRKAFPNDLSGLYVTEEMQQADNEPQAVPVHTPEIRQPAALPAAPQQPQPQPQPQPSGNTTETVCALFDEIAAIQGAESAPIMYRMFSAAGWDVSCLDDLTQEQIDRACKSARAKLDTLKQQKGTTPQ